MLTIINDFTLSIKCVSLSYHCLVHLNSKQQNPCYLHHDDYLNSIWTSSSFYGLTKLKRQLIPKSVYIFITWNQLCCMQNIQNTIWNRKLYLELKIFRSVTLSCKFWLVLFSSRFTVSIDAKKTQYIKTSTKMHTSVVLFHDLDDLLKYYHQ